VQVPLALSIKKFVDKRDNCQVKFNNRINFLPET